MLCVNKLSKAAIYHSLPSKWLFKCLVTASPPHKLFCGLACSSHTILSSFRGSHIIKKLFAVSEWNYLLTQSSRSCWNSRMWIHSHYRCRARHPLLPFYRKKESFRDSGGHLRTPFCYKNVLFPTQPRKKTLNFYRRANGDILSPCWKRWRRARPVLSRDANAPALIGGRRSCPWQRRSFSWAGRSSLCGMGQAAVCQFTLSSR